MSIKFEIKCPCGCEIPVRFKKTEIVKCLDCDLINKVPPFIECPRCNRMKTGKWFIEGLCKRCNDITKGYYEGHKKRLIANKFKISVEEYAELTKKCFLCQWVHNIYPHHILLKAWGGLDELKNYIGLCPNHHTRIHQDPKYLKRVIKKICKHKKIRVPNKIRKWIQNKS